MVGVVGYYFRPLVIPVSLCQIKQNAHLYDKQEVYVRGHLEVLEVSEVEDDYNDQISSLEKGL